jgi:hypothetical protein
MEKFDDREKVPSLYADAFPRRSTLSLDNMPAMPRNLQDIDFDRPVQLRDAYRIMETFLVDALARGDISISDFLHAFVGSLPSGETTDPAMLEDFLAASTKVVGRGG